MEGGHRIVWANMNLVIFKASISVNGLRRKEKKHTQKISLHN